MTAVDGLLAVQEASYATADAAIRGAWPAEQAMDAAALGAFLEERRVCVLATSTARGLAQARPLGFMVDDGAFWLATGAGGRLRNLARTPWASLVVSDCEGALDRVVVADGPVRIVERPEGELLKRWRSRFERDPAWAEAWLELRPARLYSYTRA